MDSHRATVVGLQPVYDEPSERMAHKGEDVDPRAQQVE